MAKELEFIEINHYKPVNQYLRHMENMFHVKLSVGDTYNDLFSKLTERASSLSEELKQAAQSWIDFNKESQEDDSVFNQVVLTENNGNYDVFAVFNFFTPRESVSEKLK